MMLRCVAMMRGGGETQHLAWIRELTAMGVDVELITGRPLFGSMKHPVTASECRDTLVMRSPYARDLVYAMQNRRGFGRLGVTMLHADEEWFCRAAWRHLVGRSGRSTGLPDIVHAHALHQAARLKTIDVPVAISMFGEPNPRYVADIQKADVLLSDGWGARRLPSMLGRPVENVAKGVDAALFSPEGPNVRESIGAGAAPVALVVSRLVPIKNVGLFIEAIAAVHRGRPDVRAVVIGDGPLDGSLKQRVAALGLDRVVLFAGYVEQRDLPKWYRSADVFVLSSDFDNSPNVVLEAMASGLPVVATDVGGVSEYVEAPAGGVLVPKGDALQLGRRISEFMADPHRRREAGAFNRRRAVQWYSWRTSAERLLAVYRNAMGARGHAA
jgi:glycosyltransferase involved in cell wall biosynthesis